MNRFFAKAALATVALTLLGVAQTWAAGPRGQSSSHHGSISGSHGDRHSFRASTRFDYRSHGFRSLSWSHYRWSNYYHCYCYYTPKFGWCFYEPTYSYYVPISYFSEVYPQSAPVVSPTPSVIQQTTVVTVPPTAAPELPTPPSTPVVPTAPTAVQKTQVGEPSSK
jgi:hypothetical protein